jgi:cytochrome c-type biogenesis protein CcmH
LVLAGALLASAVALGVVAARGPAEPATVQDRVRAVASTLRCPICQDLSVADSPSGLAQQMRASIAQDLRAGMAADQVRAKFVAAYGPWILLSPPRRGLNLLAWIAPILLFLAGLVAAATTIRNWSASAGALGRNGATGDSGQETDRPDELSPADRRLLDRALRSVGDEDE